jgi:hypothetical protein
MIKRISLAITAALLVVALSAPAAFAGPLADNCTRGDKGVVTCETFDGPGNNQAGVGHTDTDTSQGNETNTSPDKGSGKTYPEGCGDETPSSSQGKPIKC